MTQSSDRDAALASFNRARVEFEDAVKRAPDAALRFKPAGEDYSLGGLIVHVTDVLRRYKGVLDTIHASDWREPIAPEHTTSPEDEALIRDGFDGAQRAAVIEAMRTAHSALVDDVNAEPAEWFERRAPVTYNGSNAPYPTSPSDIVGWVHDHYREHTQQVTDLATDWAASTR